MEDRLLTISTAAQQFNLTTGLLYAAVSDGELAAIRFRARGRIRLRESDVRGWIGNHASIAGHPASRNVHVPAETLADRNLDSVLPSIENRRFA